LLISLGFSTAERFEASSLLPDGIFFIPKITILIYFIGPSYGKCGHTLEPFGIFYRNLVDIMAIRENLSSFGIFRHVLV
jgi:hypothetical protein